VFVLVAAVGLTQVTTGTAPELPEAWNIPGGEKLAFALDRTVLVDTDLPVLRRLYVMGTLEFPVDRSNVLSVACLLIAGGELKVGTLTNPLEKEQRLLIILRASEEIFCDYFNGISVDPGTIGVYGKLSLYSAYPKKSWVHLGADIAPGNERIIVDDEVNWLPHDKIVLSSSSYEPHEAEVLTIKEIKGYHIRIYERLRHRHIEGDSLWGPSGILAEKSFPNFDYGAMVQTENSLVLQNITLVDNTIGLLAAASVSSAPLSSIIDVQIVLRNSVIVATSSSFDCIQDRKTPQSANWTSTDRAPSNARGGRIGILWPVFTSEPNQWPQEPWHKSCYRGDLDICILPNEYSTGIMYPITAERTRMLRMKDKNKFYFPPSQPRKDLEETVCHESDWENPRKYLFIDLDGRTLGLPPPVSVFPKTEAEWTGQFFN
ncbi:hypothetical protein U0070_000272, partial [Myodes glareolus]